MGDTKMGDTNWVKNFTPKADGDAEWAAGMRYLFDDANEKIGDVQKAIECFMRGAQLGNANCMRPQRLYLLDEPSAGLSPKSAQDIIERIRRFAKEDAKRAVLMVEHRLDLLSWIDRAVFLSQGKVRSRLRRMIPASSSIRTGSLKTISSKGARRRRWQRNQTNWRR